MVETAMKKTIYFQLFFQRFTRASFKMRFSYFDECQIQRYRCLFLTKSLTKSVENHIIFEQQRKSFDYQ